jgi:cyclopropane fatty-acyl-phospholipid synthase-like methyltransferase
VLDVGCAAGNFAAELAQHAENVDALDRFWHYFLLWHKPASTA